MVGVTVVVSSPDVVVVRLMVSVVVVVESAYVALFVEQFVMVAVVVEFERQEV